MVVIINASQSWRLAIFSRDKWVLGMQEDNLPS